MKLAFKFFLHKQLDVYCQEIKNIILKVHIYITSIAPGTKNNKKTPSVN